MKINNNVSSINSNSTIQRLDNIEKKDLNNEKSSNIKNTQELNLQVENNINFIRSSFTLQENLNIIEQKQNYLNDYRNSNINFEDLQKAIYNNNKLFNEEELTKIKTDLSSILNEYDIQAQNIKNNLNSFLIANENTNALNIEKDIQRIAQYIENSTTYNLNYNSATVIDLLK
jgi:hypothetical protein